jgi:hypothetical protein
MGKKTAGSKRKAVEVDQEKALEVIENQEFIAMRTAVNSWLALSTKEEQLKELADEGLIQEKGLAE